MAKHNILDVAEWFLQQQPMSHNKVQKMCYYAVAWSCALYGESIFDDSEFEAWKRGPVSQKIFDKFKENPFQELQPEGREIELDVREKKLLDSVMLTYSDNTETSLEALSETEYPWIHARMFLPDGDTSHRLIDQEDMKEYYLSIYTGNEAYRIDRSKSV